MIAGLVYLYLSRKGGRPSQTHRPTTPADSYTVVSAIWPSEAQLQDNLLEWQSDLKERVIELVLLCSSSNRWRVTRDDAVGYRQSRSTRISRGRTRKKRRSTVSFMNGTADLPEMQERPGSSKVAFCLAPIPVILRIELSFRTLQI